MSWVLCSAIPDWYGPGVASGMRPRHPTTRGHPTQAFSCNIKIQTFQRKSQHITRSKRAVRGPQYFYFEALKVSTIKVTNPNASANAEKICFSQSFPCRDHTIIRRSLDQVVLGKCELLGIHVDLAESSDTSRELQKGLDTLQDPHVRETNLFDEVKLCMLGQRRNRLGNLEHGRDDVVARVAQVPVRH